MGCVAGPSCSSDSASNSDPEPGTASRRRSPSTPPWIEDSAEALQSPRSSRSSNERYENWVEQRAAYHRGESPEPGASRRDDASDTSDDLCDSQAGKAPPRRRSPRTPRMFRAVEAQTRSCAPAASSSSDDESSDPHKTKACDAVAYSPSGSLDDDQERRRHPWMPGLRPKWPWDWLRSLVRHNCLNK